MKERIGKMEAASFLTRPAVEPLASDLLEEFSSEILQDPNKQMIGHMVRQIMEAHGYIIVRRDVRIFGNVVFRREPVMVVSPSQAG